MCDGTAGGSTGPVVFPIGMLEGVEAGRVDVNACLGALRAYYEAYTAFVQARAGKCDDVGCGSCDVGGSGGDRRSGGRGAVAVGAVAGVGRKDARGFTFVVERYVDSGRVRDTQGFVSDGEVGFESDYGGRGIAGSSDEGIGQTVGCREQAGGVEGQPESELGVGTRGDRSDSGDSKYVVGGAVDGVNGGQHESADGGMRLCEGKEEKAGVRGPNYERNRLWRKEKKEKKRMRRAAGRFRGSRAGLAGSFSSSLGGAGCVAKPGVVPEWRVGAGPQNAGRADAATIVRVLDGTDDPAVKKELAETWIRRKIDENKKASARAQADVARMEKDAADGVYDRKREVEIAILDRQLSGELSLVIPRSFKKWAQDAAAVARSVSDSSGSKAKSAGSKIQTVASDSVGVNSSVSKNASLTDATTMESVVELMDENLALKREIDALKSATERGKMFASMRAENERLKRENKKLEEGTKILMEQDIQAYNDFCAPLGYDTDDGW